MSLVAKLEVQDIDQIRSRFGQHAQILEAELKRAEVAGLTVLRDEARSLAQQIAIDGRLPNSVRFEHVSGALEGIVGSIAQTSPSIETGRKPGEVVSPALLQSWVARKGLAGETYSVKSRRRRKSGQAMTRAEHDLAWKIALTIQERGTKPLPFIIPAARNKAETVRAIFNDALGRALRKLAGK